MENSKNHRCAEKSQFLNAGKMAAKRVRSVICFVLVAAMCMGYLPAVTAAAEETAPASIQVTLPVSSGLKGPLFRQERAVISQAVSSLVKKGATSEVLTPSAELLAKFSDLGLDFQVVKTYVADSIVTERQSGAIDVSMYPAGEDAMEELMEYVRQERNMGNSISWSFTVADDCVTTITYSLSEGYSMVLDELDGTNTPVTDIRVGEDTISAIGMVSMDATMLFQAPVVTPPEAEEPTEPTEEATEPTEAVTEPTEAVTEPTEAVTEPTEAVTEPTEAATEPTEATTEPTEAPVEVLIAEETIEADVLSADGEEETSEPIAEGEAETPEPISEGEEETSESSEENEETEAPSEENEETEEPSEENEEAEEPSEENEEAEEPSEENEESEEPSEENEEAEEPSEENEETEESSEGDEEAEEPSEENEETQESAEEDVLPEDGTEEDIEAVEETCEHTATADTELTFLWGTTTVYKDYDNDGVVNEDKVSTAGDDSEVHELVVNDADDFILSYDATTGEYSAVPATSTAYYIMGVQYTCPECDETVIGAYTVDTALTYGYYVIMDAVTIASSVLDGFGISYDANDPTTIASGLETVISALKAQYGDYAQGAMAADLGIYHIMVASETDYAIWQKLNYLGNCPIEQVSAENYYELAMAMYSTMFYAEYSVDGTVIKREVKNATAVDLEKSYGAFRGYYYAKPEYFGFPTDYWLSKETDATPIGAMKTMCQYEVTDLVPTYYLDYMAEMLGQALMAYSYYAGYGEALVAVKNDVVELISSMGNASQAQKVLVVHDYLANIANFDMNSIVQMKSDPNYQTSPLGMMPYACLLTGYTETDGALCLGYAAAYSYLIQWAVMGVNNGNLNKSNVNVDFLQVRYHSDITDSSVAGDDSGFTSSDPTASTIFNETHYMNTVYLSDTGYWYNVDACYDDISTETMSQMRVETDGNVSHAYFLLAASTMDSMFEGSFDYFDSLHDGKTYFRAEQTDLGKTSSWGGSANARGTSPMGYDLSTMSVGSQREDGNYTILNNRADEGWYLSASDGYVYDADGLAVYLYKTNTQEQSYGKYNDETYESAWFTYAASQVTWDSNYFYYVLNQDANLSERMEMSDMMDDMGDNMDMDDMLENYSENKTEGADRLVRRARYGNRNSLNPDVVEDDSNSGSMGFDMASYKGNDEYTDTLFHFGLATANPTDIDEAEAYAEENSGYSEGSDGNYESNTSEEDYDEWRTKNSFLLYVLDKDQEYAENYPEVKHTLGVNDSKLYFNFANQIFAYDISNTNRSANNLTCVSSDANITSTGSSSGGSTGGWGGNWGSGSGWGSGSTGGWGGGNWGWGGNNGSTTTESAESKYQSSHFYTVNAYKSNRAFQGMSYFTDSSKGSAAFTITDHPIAALAIYDKVIWNGGSVSFRPTVVVSMGTNYAQSYLKRLATGTDGKATLDADGYVTYVSPEVSLNPYQEEVPMGAYDATYNSYGAEEGEKKKNTEFMWCANVVDAFGVALLEDLDHTHSFTEEITAATCTTDGVKISTCSCGETKTETIPATNHDLTAHAAKEATCETAGNIAYWTCSNCGGCYSDAEAKNAIAAESVYVQALGHNLTTIDAKAATCTEIGWNAYETCSRCDYTTYQEISAKGHAPAEGWSKDANGHWHACANCNEKPDYEEHTSDSTAAGQDEVCTECGYVMVAHTHSGSKTEAKAATCTEPGNSEYWTCSECGKYFSDEACTTEIEKDSWVISVSHTLTKTEAVEAKCRTEGNIAYWTCETCGKFFSDEASENEILENEWIIKALGHDFTYEDEADKRYYLSKYDEKKPNGHYLHCTRCNSTDGASSIEAHVASDCTKESPCAICGLYNVSATQTEHSFTTKASKELAREGNCEQLAAYYVQCDHCETVNYDMDPIPVEGTAPGHKWEYALTSRKDKHIGYCDVCDETTKAEVHASETKATCIDPQTCDKCGHQMAPATGHTTKTLAEKAATCTEIGVKFTHYYCEVCQAHFEDSTCSVALTEEQWKLDMLPHSFNETASDTVKTPATCTEAAVCYVKCDNCDAVSEDKTVTVGVPLGHNWGAYASIGETEHSRSCTRCDATEKELHQGTGSCTEDTVCEVCDYTMSAQPGHSFTTKASETLVSKATCTTPATYKVQCDNCSAVSDDVTVTVGEALGHKENYTYNANDHHAYCEVCNVDLGAIESHTSSGEATCGQAEICTVCGYVMEQAKSHSPKAHAAVAATCTEAGNSAYYSCSACGKYFSDITGAKEIEVDSWILPATGHNYQKGVCTKCGAEDPDYKEEINPDKNISLDVNKTYTITVSNLTTALTAEDIGNTDDTIIGVSVSSTSSSGSNSGWGGGSWGGSWGSSSRTYTSTITLTAKAAGTAYITVQDTVYEMNVTEPDPNNPSYDEAVSLVEGSTHTITVSNLTTALTANDIGNTDAAVIGVSVSSTNGSGSSSGWGGSWGSSSRTYTSTITLTAKAAGTAYITVQNTVYKVDVSAYDPENPNYDEAVALEVGSTHTITVSNLTTALTSSNIGNTNADVIGVSVSSTSSSGSNSGWGGGSWGGGSWGSSRTYTSTVTLTALSSGTSYVTVNGTVYRVIVSEADASETFEPAMFTASLSADTVNAGSSATITVTASEDVEYVAVNGQTVTEFTENNGNRIFTLDVTENAAGTYPFAVTAYNVNGLAGRSPQNLTLTVNSSNGWSWGSQNNWFSSLFSR